MSTKQEIIKNWIENDASTSDLISIVNDVNSWNGALNEYCFYWMDELDELFSNCSAVEILNRLAPNFNTGHDGFKYTIYGLESCNSFDVADDIRDNAEEIAEAIIEARESRNLYLPFELEDVLEEEE